MLASRRPELDEVLASVSEAELAEQGLVLETNLDPVRTLSVGRVTAAGLTASYHGVQRLTKDNRGAEVYGGSDLVVVRGGWDALDRIAGTRELRLAISQARVFDAALDGYPGFSASRRNYDVAQGKDRQGRWRSGVLEHSCRIGGASGAEIAALEVLATQPEVALVRASTTEVYGGGCTPPADARVLFHGVDPEVGALLRYVSVSEERDAA